MEVEGAKTLPVGGHTLLVFSKGSAFPTAPPNRCTESACPCLQAAPVNKAEDKRDRSAFHTVTGTAGEITLELFLNRSKRFGWIAAPNSETLFSHLSRHRWDNEHVFISVSKQHAKNPELDKLYGISRKKAESGGNLSVTHPAGVGGGRLGWLPLPSR